MATVIWRLNVDVEKPIELTIWLDDTDADAETDNEPGLPARPVLTVAEFEAPAGGGNWSARAFRVSHPPRQGHA